MWDLKEGREVASLTCWKRQIQAQGDCRGVRTSFLSQGKESVPVAGVHWKPLEVCEEICHVV